MGTQKKIFTGGLNSDVTSQLLPEGQDRYRLNVRVLSSDNSTEGAIETMNGNTLVSFTLPAGTSTCIGAAEDLVRKKIYYFLHNTLNNHSILEFDAVTNVIAKVFQSSILNFDLDHLITGINFIELDSSNHLLYWTDYFNEPRKINIEKGKFFMAGNFVDGYKSPFDPENLFRIKQPMLLSPTAVYDNDSTLLINRLDKKLFQFKVQYVYDDNEVTSWSPISKTSYPLSTVIVDENNVIRVTVDTGIEIVTRIRISVKESTAADFSLVVDLDKEQLGIASNTTYVYSFYNDGNYIPLEVNESNKLFDSVPKLSQAQEIIKPGRIVDGNIVEGFDPVNVDLKLSYTLGSSGPTYGVDYITVTAGGSGYTYPPIVTITGDGSGATAYAVLTADAVTSIIVTNAGSGYTAATVSFSAGGGSGATADAFLTDSILPVNSLKRGGNYIYGAIYYDHGNRSGVTNINDGRFDAVQNNGKYGTQLFIPFYTEVVNDSGELSFTMEADGAIVTSVGSGYTLAPTVAFSGGGATSQATATANVGTGFIKGIAITNAGAGYVDGTYIAVPLIGGTGAGGTANVTIAGGAVTVVVINGVGDTYLTGDTVAPDPGVVGAPGTPAVLTLTSDYRTVISITLVTPGNGYTSMPSVAITGGGGTGALAIPTLALEAITIVNGGSGYTSAPDITFINASPTTDATAHTTITGGVINSVVIDDVGAGYLTFPTLYLTGQTAQGGAPNVTWQLYNEAPSWATHYQLARTRNLSTGRYLQFTAGVIVYVDKSNNILTFGNPLINRFKITLLNVTTNFRNQNPGSILVYDFVQGDRIRFIKDSSGNFLDEYYDFAINSYDSSLATISVTFPPGVYPGTFPNLTNGCLFEIYQPQLTVSAENELTYEIGCGNTITYDSVNDKYLHDGDVADQLIVDFTSATYFSTTFTAQVPAGHGLVATNEVKILTSGYSVYGEVTSTTATSVTITTSTVLTGTFNAALGGTISKCAEGSFSGGDTFFRVRIMPYGLSGASATRLIEDVNYSDLYISRGYDYGRPNRIDKLAKEVTRISTIYWSGVFIPETFINGLSTVYDDSFESYESPNGSIQKLHSEDQNLYVFQELKIGYIPVLQNVFSGTQGGSVVGSSEQVLSPTMQYYVGEFGIGKNPESFFVYGKSKYGIDVRRGTPWRLSLDGLTPIAQTAFMNNYFTDKCKTILNSSSKIKIYGVYDTKFKEYVIAFSAGTGVTAETLAFNERANQWSTFYSYIPEVMCSNGIDIVSFKNGGLWKHNENSLQANFYGVQYQPEVWVTLNAEYSNVKVMEAVGLESTDVWTATIITPGGQETNLALEDFQLKEGMQYAPLWRDINTPNIIAPSLPLFEGDEMRDTTFLCKFKWNNTTYNKLFAINLSYTISNLHR